MGVGAIDSSFSGAQLKMDVGISLQKKIMDQQEAEALKLLSMMDKAAAAQSGHIVDIKV